MPVRFYIVPLDGSGNSISDAIRPKYIADMGVRWSGVDSNVFQRYLVGADVTAGQHTTISSNPDVLSVPLNLDTTVGASRNAVVTALESLNFPANWITAGTTFRQVLRVLRRAFGVFQRIRGMRRVWSFEGITLDTQLNSLPLAVRRMLLDAADDLKLDTSVFTLASPLRDVIKALAEQVPAATLMGEEV